METYQADDLQQEQKSKTDCIDKQNQNEEQGGDFKHYKLGIIIIQIGILTIAIFLLSKIFLIHSAVENFFAIFISISLIILGIEIIKKYEFEKEAFKEFRTEKHQKHYIVKKEVYGSLIDHEQTIEFRELEEGQKLDYKSLIFLFRLNNKIIYVTSRTIGKEYKKPNKSVFFPEKNQKECDKHYIKRIRDFIDDNGIILIASLPEDSLYYDIFKLVKIKITKNHATDDERDFILINAFLLYSLFKRKENVSY